MTRTARRQRQKHLEASSWSELSRKEIQRERISGVDGHVRKKKRKEMEEVCVKAEKTLGGENDLVNIVKDRGSSMQKKGHHKPKVKFQRKSKGRVANEGFKDLLSEKKMIMREKRRLRRAKMKECFGCRQTGHRIEDCPNKKKEDIGLCFKCGSIDHGIANCRVKVPPGTYPFATCFICGEKGHLTRTCPDNPKGLYPHGGGCGFCGSVEHLKASCPSRHSSGKGGHKSITLQIQGPTSADAEDTSEKPKKLKKLTKKSVKTVRF